MGTTIAMKIAVANTNPMVTLIPVSWISWPPLKPMAKSKYKENNLGKGWGMSRSDLRNTAIMPIKKKRTGGLRTLERIRLAFKVYNV